MSELVEVLEAAPGPSRDLDGRIAVAIRLWDADDIRHLGGGVCASDSQSLMHAVPEYTRSIDAALQALPKEWWLEHLGDDVSAFDGEPPRMTGACAEVTCHGMAMASRYVQGMAVTRALAICSAAIKALDGYQ